LIASSTTSFQSIPKTSEQTSATQIPVASLPAWILDEPDVARERRGSAGAAAAQ
jgi:hypothetical protein